MVKLWRFLRPDWLAVVLVLVFTFVQTMSSLYLPTLMSHIVDTGVIRGDIPYIIRVGGAMLAVTVLGGAAAVVASWFGAHAAATFGQRIRSQLFRQVEHFTLREFDQVGTSSLIVRTTNDVMQVQQLVNMMLRMMVMAPLTAIGGILLAIYTDRHLAWILAFAVPVLGLTIWLVMGRSTRLFRLVQTRVDSLNRVLRENLTGIRVIRAFHRSRFEAGRFDEANQALTGTSTEVFQLMASLMPAVMMVMNLAIVAVVWLGGIEINQGTLQIGQLMAFIQYVTQVMFSIMMLSWMSFMIPRGQASANRINQVLEMRPDISNPAEPRTPASRRGLVEFRQVSFRYPGAEELALAEVSFTATPGQTTAIIGGTGAGKSTLLNLIPRFYDVADGQILIDGVDVREMTQDELRSRIGYIPQRAVLFSGSIADNVRYGRLDATDEEVRRACETAQAAEFIEAMDGGYGADIAQGGADLSGGQRQRLSIARALVRRAQIYLFDDSFSALDFKTDAALRRALAETVAGATVIIVAQRVSTVMDADQIIVLDDGRVAGRGTHQELMEYSPVYREIVSSQLSPEEIA
jgi:ATP-binding cassette subfamily B multidrug efflux pump